jgi:CO/xanthine dehydrogenase FAD-binding subunit
MVKHFIPSSLEEALNILNKEKVEIIAGGTDLMVQRRKWANTAPAFKQTMNIINIPELSYIKAVNNKLHIGATTSLTEIANHDNTPELMKKAIYDIASPALRNIATIAGNIGNASPAGDTLPILYVLNAKIVLVSPQATRTLPIEEVILGPRKTVIKDNELIKEIILPIHTFTSTSFVKVGGRKADAISKVSFTGAVTIEDNIVLDIRIAFGAVGPVIVRSTKIENSIIEMNVEQIKDSLDHIVEAYSDLITPIDDQRSNKEYRKTVAKNLLKDFLLHL